MSSSSTNPTDSDPQDKVDPSAVANDTDQAILPKVQPPTAGFIFQLFIIPGLIVCIIVGIWMTMNWLARDNTDPRDYLKKIQSKSGDRGHAAYNLASALSDTKNQELLYDAEFAKELGNVLVSEVESEESEKPGINIRSALCLAAGKFHISEPLESLMFAADVDNEESLDVRVSAMVSIFSLAQNVRSPIIEEFLPAVHKICRNLAKENVKEEASQQFTKVAESAKSLVSDYLREEHFSQALVSLADDVDRVVTLISIEGDEFKTQLESLQAYTQKIRTQSEHAKKFQWDDHPNLAKLLKQAAGTQNEEYDNQGSELKARVAFVLPYISGKGSTELLLVMLDDAEQAVRYNAANGLARLGNMKSNEVLIEMLDPEMGEFKLKEEFQRKQKRNLIIWNALQSISNLAELNSAEKFQATISALETMLSSDESLTKKNQVNAKELLERLKKR